MRIALLSTCALTTPPAAYGGTELVISEIAHGLVELGHDVSVLAAAGSHPKGRLYTCSPGTCWPPNDLAEMRHAAVAWEIIAREGFDVVHVHHATALPFNHLLPEACLLTLHHVRNAPLIEHYRAFPEVAYVAISHRQAELSPELRFEGVVHHGLDPARYPAGAGRGGYGAFLARFAPEKAPHLAMIAGRKAGVPIRLGGRPDDVTRDQEYFHRKVLPLVEGNALLGELPHVPKVAFLGGARALLVPLDWEEPFGLNIIEAMLVGTPVIAFARGAVPEIIDEGLTGFVVHSVDEMAERLRQLDGFDRRACRARAIERWSYRRMAADYLQIYERLARAAPGRALTGADRRGAWGPNGEPEELERH